MWVLMLGVQSHERPSRALPEVQRQLSACIFNKKPLESSFNTEILANSHRHSKIDERGPSILDFFLREVDFEPMEG